MAQLNEIVAPCAPHALAAKTAVHLLPKMRKPKGGKRGAKVPHQQGESQGEGLVIQLGRRGDGSSYAG